MQSISVGSLNTVLAQLVEYGKHTGNEFLYKINRRCVDFTCLVQQVKQVS